MPNPQLVAKHRLLSIVTRTAKATAEPPRLNQTVRAGQRERYSRCAKPFGPRRPPENDGTLVIDELGGGPILRHSLVFQPQDF